MGLARSRGGLGVSKGKQEAVTRGLPVPNGISARWVRGHFLPREESGMPQGEAPPTQIKCHPMKQACFSPELLLKWGGNAVSGLVTRKASLTLWGLRKPVPVGSSVKRIFKMTLALPLGSGVSRQTG